MRVAIYCRVSTLHNGQDVSMQSRDLRELSNRRGFTIVKEYCDEGQSGSKSSRPALDELLTDAKKGKFKAILIWKLDRLGRSLSHLIRLLEDFRVWNIELISFSEGLDFTTPTGKLMYQLLSAFGEFEAECIRERVRAGLRNARAKGVRLGRPRSNVDPLLVGSLRAQGASWRVIAARLGVSVGTAFKLGKSPPKPTKDERVT